MKSRLTYSGTNEIIRVGDRIRIRSYGSDKLCVVSEICQNAGDSLSAVQQCGFRTEDGVLHSADLETGKLGKHIQLICHAGEEVETVVTALGGSTDKHPPLSWLDAFRFLDFGYSVYLLLGLIVSLIMWLFIST